MKVLQIGLCVQPKPFNGFQTPFIEILGEENYREISTGEKDLNPKVLNMAQEFKPDLIFMQIQAEGIISKKVIETLYGLGIKIINWTGDVRHDTPKWMYDIAPYCLSSFSNMVDVKNMIRKGYKAKYLEIGYDPLIYRPEGETTTGYDIVFMGNNYGQFPLSGFRVKLVNELKNKYGDRFGLFGSGWAKANGNNNASQHDQAKIYRSSKIAINCSQFNYERYSSDRLLRILGTGGAVCLSHEYNGITQDYEKGVHLDTFNTIDSCIGRIEYLLAHDEERIKIATAGMELVRNRNTFYHQVKNILEL